MKNIRADIKNKTFRPVYLIYGEEAFVRNSLRNELKAALAGEDDMNLMVMEGRDVDVNKIIEFGLTMPFFADHRLIIAENTGWFKKEPEGLADALDAFPDTTVLVIVEESIDKRSRLYKKIDKIGYVSECTRLKQDALLKWAARRIGAAGKKVRESTCREFLSMTGDDMENIKNELDKLISYVGDREEITTDDVYAITTRQIQGRIFDLVDAVAVRDRNKALTLYYDLLTLREPPMKILALIARQFHLLMQVKELRTEGVGSAEIAQILKLRPFVADRMIRQAGRFSDGELNGYVERYLEYDSAIKRGDLSDRLACELLIVSFSE